MSADSARRTRNQAEQLQKLNAETILKKTVIQWCKMVKVRMCVLGWIVKDDFSSIEII